MSHGFLVRLSNLLVGSDQLPSRNPPKAHGFASLHLPILVHIQATAAVARHRLDRKGRHRLALAAQSSGLDIRPPEASVRLKRHVVVVAPIDAVDGEDQNVGFAASVADRVPMRTDPGELEPNSGTGMRSRADGDFQLFGHKARFGQAFLLHSRAYAWRFAACITEDVFFP